MARPSPDTSLFPFPCTDDCGRTWADDARLSEITCPCGYGYYIRETGEFVPGIEVRLGRKPTRDEYERHVRRCSKQRPVPQRVAERLPNERPESFTDFPGLEATYPSSAELGSNLVPRDRLQPDKGANTVNTTSQLRPSRPKPVLDRNIEQAKPIFIPKEKIEREPLLYYLALCGYKKITLQNHTKEQTPGWLLKGLDSSAQQLNWKVVLTEVIKDSKLWRDEVRIRVRERVPYQESKARAERDRRGIVGSSPGLQVPLSPTPVSTTRHFSDRRHSNTSENTDRSNSSSMRHGSSVSTTTNDSDFWSEDRWSTVTSNRLEDSSGTSRTGTRSSVLIPIRSRNVLPPRKETDSSSEEDPTAMRDRFSRKPAARK